MHYARRMKWMDKDTQIKNYLIGKTRELEKELLKLDSLQSVEQYMKWAIEKLQINDCFANEELLLNEISKLDETKELEKIAGLKKQKFKYSQQDKPFKLNKGDLINIKFGVGVGHELDGQHYGIILSNRGAMFLIAPLTSTPQDFGKYSKSLKDLGLPREEGKSSTKSDISYVSFSQIRYIHVRRITKIKKIFNQKDYKEKLELGVDVANDIIQKYFDIINYKY